MEEITLVMNKAKERDVLLAKARTTLQREWQWIVLLVCFLLSSFLLSKHLPGQTALFSGPKLYTPANFKYNAADTVFDDTVLTYGTDYALAVIMSVLCWNILSVPRTEINATLRSAAAFLVGGFALSTFTGGICHHLIPYSINTWYWRLMWRICVGSVAASGGALGLCGSEMMPHENLKAPAYFWYTYGGFFLGVTWLGYFSMRNPACDLFLTGVSQAGPTIYLACAVLLRKPRNARDIQVVQFLYAGLLSNIILLPGYDLINYLQWRDGVCNAFLHTFLCVSWSCQGVALRHFIIEGKQE